MKKIIGLLFLFISITVYSQNQLTTFGQIVDNLDKGMIVRAVFHYNQCQLISDNLIEDKAPDAFGGMTLETFEYFEKGSVRNEKAFFVSSTSHLIEYPKGEGYVFNYVKLKVYEDNSVRIIARYLDAIDYSVKMDESFYTEINDNKNSGGAFFYLLD